MRAGSDFHVNCRIVRPDDTIRHIESFARPVFDDAGEVTEYIGTMIDITEREQSEQTLQEHQQRLACSAGIFGRCVHDSPCCA